MADTTTANYKFVKPEVGGSGTTWGTKLNSDLDMIDAQLFTSAGALTSNNLNLTSNPGTAVTASLTFMNGGSATGQQKRWALTEDVGAEVGGNVGSNLSLTAYNDTGALLSTPMAINRASGGVTFNTATSFVGAATFGALSATGTATFATLTATGTATFATLNATTLNATTLNLSGAGTVSGGLTVSNQLYVASGAATFAAAAQVNGGLTVNAGLNVASGAATFTGGVNGATSFNSNISVAGTGTFNAVTATGNCNAANLVLPAGGAIAGPGGSLQYDGASWSMVNGSGGNFLVQNNSAFKPGGGVWATLSDARIKNVTGEYEAGLDEVLQLRPVTYTYKGNDTPTADGVSPHRHAAQSGKAFVGFVAQELEQILPGMVSQREGFIDGEKATDIRDVDVSSLLYALVNCVKQLKAEIEALKR